jgi:cytochrome bd ubiquinol oxidase subunit II
MAMLWFCLATAMIAGYVILDGFDLGAGIVQLLVAKTERKKAQNVWQQFGSHPWGVVFPALALAGLVGVRVLGTRRQDRGAFLASSLYLAGMLASVAFGVFPNVLPSNTTPELSLTIDNAAAAEHGLVIGLWWFIPGMALVIAYSVLTYRHVAGKVE